MDMNTRLAQISEVMADGYHFFKMMECARLWQQDALMGDPDAQKILDIMSQFHRLCLIVKGE